MCSGSKGMCMCVCVIECVCGEGHMLGLCEREQWGRCSGWFMREVGGPAYVCVSDGGGPV